MKLIIKLLSLNEGFFKKKPKAVWDILNAASIKRYGDAGEFGFDTLRMTDAMKLVDFKKADELAKTMRLLRDAFWANEKSDMRYLINKNPEVLIGDAAELLKSTGK